MQHTAPTDAQAVSPTGVHRAVPEQTYGRSFMHEVALGAQPAGGGKQPAISTKLADRNMVFMVSLRSARRARARRCEKF